MPQKPWRRSKNKPVKRYKVPPPHQPPDVRKVKGTGLTLTPDDEERYRWIRANRGLPEPGSED